jgi:hypothetical protein
MGKPAELTMKTSFRNQKVDLIETSEVTEKECETYARQAGLSGGLFVKTFDWCSLL